jgi:cytochrome c oxidase assembly factor CtaG
VVDPGRFVLDWAWIAALVVAAIDYAVLARRGHPTPAWRAASFAAGLAVVAAAVLSPIEHLAVTSMLAFHLLQNVMLADWAPPLLVLGLTPAMAAALTATRPAWLLTHPAVALPLWLGVWYVVHLPAVYDAALRRGWALGLEHLAFLAAGLAFWWPVLQPGRMRAGTRVLYLFGAFVAAGPVALVIALATSPLYDFYLETPKLWGLTPLEDQQAGGILMGAEQSIVLFVAFLVALAKLFDEEDAAEEAEGGKVPA